MAERLKVDVCVIGGGSGGLSVAAGASQMGASTVLLEKGHMGGDCLNFGCVPSKALLAAGKAVHHIATAGRFGVDASLNAVDHARVHDHVHGVIAAIAPHDSVERFEGLGVKVIQAAGRFTGPRTVVAGDTEISARRFVVATGSSALVPPIDGLADTPYFTNETIFENASLLPHLIVIGAGPIGLEMAQAHRRLGSAVSVIEMARALPNDDPELTSLVVTKLKGEGIDLIEGAKVAAVRKDGEGVAVAIEEGEGNRREIAGSHLLIAAGRRANVADLGLEEAGVEYSPRGIQVDARLRTSNKKIFAIGDVAGGLQFTHVAGYHAGIVIRNILFRLPAKADHSAVPWVTYTDPELAHIGLGEEQARQQHGDIRILRWSYGENDRAQAELATDGMIKVVTAKNGRILGASIVGAQAGELIQPWVLAMTAKMKIGKMAGYIAPYPTMGEIGKRAAGSYFVPSLFSERTKKVVRFLARFG